MTKVALKHPITIDGNEVSAITLRRPKAKDMIALGDHLPALASLDPDTENSTSGLKAMNRAAFEAMTAIVGRLSDLGDAAQELDFEDLVTASTEAFGFMGELDGAGTAKTGAAP